jgi:D-alanyl-D-alanine carboxypeptidase (penicillin-binding protein 5/6)
MRFNCKVTTSCLTSSIAAKRTGSFGTAAVLTVFIWVFVFCFSLPSVSAADEIRSRAAVVMDSVTGRVLYAKNPDQRLLPASTTKLMTALVVLDHATLDTVTTVSRNAAATPPTKAGLKEGDNVTIETLLYAALMKSANDAAVVLSEAVAGSQEQFVRMMNVKAAAIGANDTHFVNATGLPADGQYITAYDLAKIMRTAIKYPLLKEIIGTRVTAVTTEDGKAMMIKNTNKLLWSDDELLGGKTGYTREARHCFVCVGERNDEKIIVALLGAPSRSTLWKEAEELMAFGAKVINNDEEPVVYLTRNSRPGFTRASYTPGRDGDVVQVKKKSSRRKALAAGGKKHTSSAKSIKGRKRGTSVKSKRHKKSTAYAAKVNAR